MAKWQRGRAPPRSAGSARIAIEVGVFVSGLVSTGTETRAARHSVGGKRSEKYKVQINGLGGGNHENETQ
jgi:hypothetical protein